MPMIEGALERSAPTVGSPCLKCGSQMALSRIEPENPGYEHHVFECAKCGHLQSQVVEIQ
jgi:hypothetical protein